MQKPISRERRALFRALNESSDVAAFFRALPVDLQHASDGQIFEDAHERFAVLHHTATSEKVIGAYNKRATLSGRSPVSQPMLEDARIAMLQR